MKEQTVESGITLLLQAAQEGDRVCLGQLAEFAEPRLLGISRGHTLYLGKSVTSEGNGIELSLT